VTAFPLSRARPGMQSLSYGGKVPFEALLRPGARIEVLHAEMAPDGHPEFDAPAPTDPPDPGAFTPNPDHYYKVKTYSGEVTIPDGEEGVVPPDPEPPGYVALVNYFAKTTTDNTVITYSLVYSAEDTVENPDGWRTVTTGSRTTGERFIYATETAEDAPEIIVIEGVATDALTYTEEALSTYSGGITITLSSAVTDDDMTPYCEEKLADMKDRVDEEDSGITTETEVDSYQKEDLSLKLAAVRMAWEGSAMFDPLPGTLNYFNSPLRPDFTLTHGNWKIEVSSPISASELYYDALGFYGEASIWNEDFSLFAGITSISNAFSAIYPPAEDFGIFSQMQVRIVSVDGKKRRFIMQVRDGVDGGGGVIYRDLTLTTSEVDGLANATVFFSAIVDSSGAWGQIIGMSSFDADDVETVEWSDEVYIPVPVYNFLKMREWNEWGFVGFTSSIPPENPEDPYPEPLATRYRTMTLSGDLVYSAKDADPVPAGVIGMVASGVLSGSITLADPPTLIPGSLASLGRRSRTTTGDASPFKTAWTAGEKDGEFSIDIVTTGSSGASMFINSPLPAPLPSGEVTFTETSWEMVREEADLVDRPVRPYRQNWPLAGDSKRGFPTQRSTTFSLGPPPTPGVGEDPSREQKSAWEDLGVPTAGTSWWSETGGVGDLGDEFSCYVGE